MVFSFFEGTQLVIKSGFLKAELSQGKWVSNQKNMILPMQDNTVFNNKLCLFTFRLQYKEYCHKIEEKIHFNCPSPIVSLVNTDVMS